MSETHVPPSNETLEQAKADLQVLKDSDIVTDEDAEAVRQANQRVAEMRTAQRLAGEAKGTRTGLVVVQTDEEN